MAAGHSGKRWVKGSPRSVRLSGLLALLALLAGCAAPPALLPHQAYVWQRAWTTPVKQAVMDDTLPLQGLRVLAWQIDDHGAVAAGVDAETLAQRALPVRAVLRIEGHRPRLAAATVAAHARKTLTRWRAAGVRVDGIEIDHDCASASLDDYARWLVELRALLPEDTLLSITALPTWLDAPGLAALRAASDESVLQVHAIDARSGTLFDAAEAADWARRWGDSSPRPYWVALPAYALRVQQDARGKALIVDGEGAIDHSGAAGREWRADPTAVSELLVSLQDEPSPALRGLLWFRLPVEGDRRSWRTQTLKAVIDGAPLVADFHVAAQRSDPALHDLVLHNTGNRDAALPARLALPAGCDSGDGVAGYRWDAATPALIHAAPVSERPWLAAGARQPVGWVRCAAPLPATLPSPIR